MKLKDFASLLGLELPENLPKQENPPAQENLPKQEPSTKEESAPADEKKPEKKPSRKPMPNFYKNIELESIQKDIDLISDLQEIYRKDSILSSILAKAKRRLSAAAKSAKKK